MVFEVDIADRMNIGRQGNRAFTPTGIANKETSAMDKIAFENPNRSTSSAPPKSPATEPKRDIPL